MTLNNAEAGREYIVRAIQTDDEEMDAFLFSLGCFSGQPITVIAHRRGGCVVSIKDGRYTIDDQLAGAIRGGAVAALARPCFDRTARREVSYI